MKFMKLGSKPDSFQSEGDNIRYVSSELATDVIVTIGDVKFYLHKFPLLSKSAKLQKLITSSTSSSTLNNNIEDDDDQIRHHHHQQEDEIEITEIPGGPATFEICAKFCYGMTVTLNAYNVISARCAAEYLEMYESVEKGNLVYKIEVFLNSSILQTWKDSIIALQTTRTLTLNLNQEEEDLLMKLTNRCLDSIASKACIDTSKVEWSYTYSKKKNLDNGLRKPQTVPRDWWVEDLCDLHIELYKRAISTIRGKGIVENRVIGEALHAYAIRRIPGFAKGGVQVTDFAKYRDLADSVIQMIPDERRSVSCGFLTKLLRSSVFLGCEDVDGLVKRVGERLDEAELRDVMSFDVDLMIGLVEVFVKSRCLEEEEEEGLVKKEGAVAKLVDGYLAEKSRDSENLLCLEKFLVIAEMVSRFPRESHDGVYRAIDMFVKEHPEMNKSEKKRLCKLMDCRKLSPEACAHAVQNERLPMRVVVQVLFFEQVRANNNSSSTGNSTPEIIVPNTSRSTDQEDSWDTEDIKALKGELANLRLAKNQQQQEKKVAKGGGVSRVFSKLWNGKERSSGEMMMMSSSGTSSPGSVNDDSKSSSSTSKKH